MKGMKTLNWINPTAEVLACAIKIARDEAVDAALNALKPPIFPEEDTLLTTRVYEAGIATFRGYTEWLPVEEVIWKSWTGLRKVDGEMHHGPVVNMDRPDVPYTGPRECACSTCQASVTPSDRLN